jgi:hypothetical protein
MEEQKGKLTDPLRAPALVTQAEQGLALGGVA